MARTAVLAAIVALGALGAPACGGDGGGAEPEVLVDMEFPAFVDGDTSGDPIPVSFGDYAAESRPGTRILMISAAAGWCAPCMREAQALPEFAASYEPRGVAILVAVFQDQNGEPARADFARSWVDTFGLTVPVLIDTEFQTSRYFDVNTMPANMFVDAASFQILSIAAGAETGDDPMQEYRELLDHYLE